jgi:fumarylacetoacetate (FAA) hydrolase
MKLASINNGTRDGQLVLVDSGLTRALAVPDVAATLQQLLDGWDALAPELLHRHQALERGELRAAMPFSVGMAVAPLPRAYQFCDGSAYLSHAELVRKARKAEMPSFLYHDPLMYQGGSDSFLGPLDDIEVADESWGIDLEAEVTVITGDVPMGAGREVAQRSIRLVTILNDVSLRNLIPHELSKGFGFIQSKPSTAFAAVAVTPDSLPDWDGSKLCLPLQSWVNDVPLGRPDAGVDMSFDFPDLIVHAARTRRLTAGTVVGSGTVSNRDRAAGSSCLAEKRMLELIDKGEAATPFLRFGDTVRIDMRDRADRTVFGEIKQRVVRYAGR